MSTTVEKKRWFFNNGTPGAAEAAQKFAWQNGIGAWFAWSPERLEWLKDVIDHGGDEGPNTPSARIGGFNVPARAVLCLVERVGDDRTPNKDIVDVQIYPPFEDPVKQEAVRAQLIKLMDLANTNQP
jgi:hypothetical protein